MSNNNGSDDFDPLADLDTFASGDSDIRDEIDLSQVDQVDDIQPPVILSEETEFNLESLLENESDEDFIAPDEPLATGGGSEPPDDGRGHVISEPNRNSIKGMFKYLLLGVFLIVAGVLAFYLVNAELAKDQKVASKEAKIKTKAKISEQVPAFVEPALVKPKPKIVLPKPTPITKPRIIATVKPKADDRLARKLRNGFDDVDAANAEEDRAAIAAGKQPKQRTPSINQRGITSDGRPRSLAVGANGSPTSDDDGSGVKVARTERVAAIFKNPTMTISTGTRIPCTLETAIQSDQKGQITCMTARDIFSMDGTTVLIEKGSFATGTYDTTSLNFGDARIFATWSEIRTPNNVQLLFDSETADGLGRGGIGGIVDNKFLRRYSGLLLASLTTDLINSRVRVVTEQNNTNRVTSNETINENSTSNQSTDSESTTSESTDTGTEDSGTNSDTTDTSSNVSSETTNLNENRFNTNDTTDGETTIGALDATTDTIEEIANDYLGKFANARPTLHKAHGEELHIVIIGNLDLSDVYEVRNAR